MKRTKRIAAAVLALALAVAPAVAADEGIPAIMAERDSGEDIAALIAESEAKDWAVPVEAPADKAALTVGGKGAVLMEVSTGQILFERDSRKHLPIASVTKVMTLLLVMEAVDEGKIALTDMVTCSAEAASYGGSQIWLRENERMSVGELVKAAAVVSANDACAALAEHISGSVEGFVEKMNARAAELGLKDTRFLDCCGLNDEAYSCAYDVAVISRALIGHELIRQYTTIWMDTLRNGQSQLVNTNKLVRFYPGATGLKTGTTAAAGHCLSATAERQGLSLVAVILGCDTTAERFGGARKMLDYGFANYAVITPKVDQKKLTSIPVRHGLGEQVEVEVPSPSPVLVRKGEEAQVTCEVELAADLQAPVVKGQTVGKLRVSKDGQTVATLDVLAAQNVGRLTFFAALERLLRGLAI
ncbi:MAG: D-alanyl-D-alanine carboxypeptidase family protein [Acutalibacteraceae bacterium]|jgi:D-alanyl-D-alanine carboxypeptidase (penicillin-binding protein 5/6)